MTRPRILIAVEDPGAVLYLRGLAQALDAAGMEPVTVATGHAKGVLPGALTMPGDPAGLLARESPAALVVGTSENPQSPAFVLTAAARARGIPVIGAVDSAANAASRFAGTGSDPLAHAPDALLVPDRASAAAFAELGFSRGAIHVTGHPRLDEIATLGAGLDSAARAELRRRLCPGAPVDARVAVFVSELSTGLGGEARYRRGPGYGLAGDGTSDRRTDIVAQEAVRALGRTGPVWTVLRLHPKQDRAEETALAALFDQVSQSEPALDLCLSADLICGMTSVLLVEAAALGLPVLSIVPQTAEREWLGDAGQAIPSVSTRAALEAWLAGPWLPTLLEQASGSALDHMVAAIAAISGKEADHAV